MNRFFLGLALFALVASCALGYSPSVQAQTSTYHATQTVTTNSSLTLNIPASSQCRITNPGTGFGGTVTIKFQPLGTSVALTMNLYLDSGSPFVTSFTPSSAASSYTIFPGNSGQLQFIGQNASSGTTTLTVDCNTLPPAIAKILPLPLSVANGGTATSAPNPTATGTCGAAYSGTWPSNLLTISCPSPAAASPVVATTPGGVLTFGCPTCVTATPAAAAPLVTTTPGGVLTFGCTTCVTNVTASGNLSSSGGTTPAITETAGPTYTTALIGTLSVGSINPSPNTSPLPIASPGIQPWDVVLTGAAGTPATPCPASALCGGSATAIFGNAIWNSNFLRLTLGSHGTNDVADATTAGEVRIASNGTFRYYADTGLTVGNTYTPTQIFNIDTGGSTEALASLTAGSLTACSNTAGYICSDTGTNTGRFLFGGTTDYLDFASGTFTLNSGNLVIAGASSTLTVGGGSAITPYVGTWTCNMSSGTCTDSTSNTGIPQLLKCIVSFSDATQTAGTKVHSAKVTDASSTHPTVVAYSTSASDNSTVTGNILCL